METITSENNLLTPAPPADTRHNGIARKCGSFAVRFLKAFLHGYVESARYYPYWIGFAPPYRRTPRSYR